MSTMDKIDAIVDDREEQHGPFIETSRVIQNIKAAFKDSRNWEGLPPDQKEALEMVAHKAGRILTGAGDSYDSWADLSGYPSLVEERLRPVSIKVAEDSGCLGCKVDGKPGYDCSNDHPEEVVCANCA